MGASPMLASLKCTGECTGEAPVPRIETTAKYCGPTGEPAAICGRQTNIEIVLPPYRRRKGRRGEETTLSAPAIVKAAAFALVVMGCAPSATVRMPVDRDLAARAQVLNRLRDDINAAYGFRDGTPRINLGPCGRFARDFRERWNARFSNHPTHVIFVMADDGSQCHHVLVRLPDGYCYDGGNGVMWDQTLLAVYPNAHIDEMTTFDPALLDRRSYGLGRSYPECPNYSDELTRRLIDHYLAMLAEKD
jgi:hypothetical protein